MAAGGFAGCASASYREVCVVTLTSLPPLKEDEHDQEHEQHHDHEEEDEEEDQEEDQDVPEV